MSLADYQDAWNQLLFDDSLREDWENGKAVFTGLSESESLSINSLAPDRVALIAPSTVRGRVHIFYHSIPKYISNLIEDDTRQKLSYTYALKYPDAGMYPRSEGMVSWLGFIKHTLAKNARLVCHLEDLLNYAIVAAGLVFFRIPEPLVITTGPKLIHSTGLITAGPEFKTVLENLKTGQAITDLPDSPKHGYLLNRDHYTTNVEQLHWTVFELLHRCTGENSIEEIIAAMIEENPDLEGQSDSLQGWYKYYLKQGVLA